MAYPYPPPHGSAHYGQPAPGPPHYSQPAPPHAHAHAPHPFEYQTLHQFGTQQGPQHPQSPFAVVQDKFLQVNLGGPSSTGAALSQILIKAGSMVAYTGEVGFERQSLREEGVGTILKKALLTSDGVTLTKATLKGAGPAQLFLADAGKHVTVVRLQGDSIIINGNDVLAFEPSVRHKIVRMKSVSSVVSGGFFSIKLDGTGLVAFLTHGKPLTLQVAPGLPPVHTDPQATVAWSGDLTPDFNTDFHFAQLVGRGSGDAFQMQFSKGTGVVFVQPFEEVIPS